MKIDGTAVWRTYIYLISKVVDGKRYYKLGEGTRSIKRITDAATYLVPGDENRWFQVHMLVFYELSPYKTEFSTLIEKECHKVLRREFPQYVLRFTVRAPLPVQVPLRVVPASVREALLRVRAWHDRRADARA